MSKTIDVVKLARIALCFAGILIILSGVQTGLTLLENREFLVGHPTTAETAWYVVGMLIFCLLVFAKVFIGVLCIRYNQRIAYFLERYSRKNIRYGKKRWKRSEIHAFFCVVFGATLFYLGIVDILNTTAFVIQACCVRRDFFEVVFSGDVAFLPMGLIVMLLLLLRLIPGPLLVLFARRLTAWVDRRL
jgi:hypothetical protein